jgi:hypothetical protein
MNRLSNPSPLPLLLLGLRRFRSGRPLGPGCICREDDLLASCMAGETAFFLFYLSLVSLYSNKKVGFRGINEALDGK